MSADREPSQYERRAWSDLHLAREQRLLSKGATATTAYVEGLARKAAESIDRSPRLSRMRDAATSGTGKAANKTPERLKNALGQGANAANKVMEGFSRAASRVATASLSGDRVIKAHQRRGHQVAKISDIRVLDLELVDKVKPRNLDLAYSTIAALSGAGSGITITGGEIVSGATGGAGAAPSLPVVAGVVTADAAGVLLLANRVVAHVGLYYGYEVTRPEEKIFLLSVVNFGTAVTAGAKAKAYSDLSRLTQWLYRGKSWAQLGEVGLTKVAQKLSAAIGYRLTQNMYSRFVPVAGIAAGASLNWLTLEQIADAADLAYRRRFLLERYPQLIDLTEQPFPPPDEACVDEGDPGLSVFDLIEEERDDDDSGEFD